MSPTRSRLPLVDYQTIDALRERHPAWRLLRAGKALKDMGYGTLILSFLGAFFVEGNRRGRPANEVAAVLEDHRGHLADPAARRGRRP